MLNELPNFFRPLTPQHKLHLIRTAEDMIVIDAELGKEGLQFGRQ
jgi:hypothetical protein